MTHGVSVEDGVLVAAQQPTDEGGRATAADGAQERRVPVLPTKRALVSECYQDTASW